MGDMHRLTHYGDITGNTYGYWTVIKPTGRGKWLCRCSCGNIKEVYKKSLVQGKSKSCGCHLNENRKDNFKSKYIGKTYNYWTVLDISNNSTFKCRCKCGKIKDVNRLSILNNKSKSCGCMAFELSKITCTEKYGEPIVSRIHNPRTEYQINLINDKNAIIEMIKEKYNGHIALKDLSYELGVTEYHASRIAKSNDLISFIDVSTSRSSFELSVFNFVESIYDGDIKNNIKMQNGKELDIYIPDKKFAIECNGDYWHSDLFKDKYYHRNKSLYCKNTGIHLIHIFEYEWNNDTKQRIIKDIIRNTLDTKYNEETIYVKDTIIKELDNSEIKEFLDNNHLQGYVSADINIGLFENNTLLALMTIDKSRLNKNYQYEIVRICCKTEYGITEAFSKIFNYFKSKYNPVSIIGYSDIAKFKTWIYDKLDFKLAGYTAPSYVWSNGNNVFTRNQCEKHKLIKVEYDDNTSEIEIMKQLGYNKIYDCGNYKFVWTK